MSESGPRAEAVRGRERMLAVALVLGATVSAVVLTTRGWGKWGDVLVDHGRELYVPWRIAEGDVLYRDLAYFNGPLSAYWNALWFRLFGVSSTVQAAANLVLIALCAALLYHLSTRLAGRVAAGLALAFAVPVFFLAHTLPGGNYNFIAPYSHEMTHGLLLSLAALAVALRASPERPRTVAAVGALLGLVFLTKLELFVATTGGVLALLIPAQISHGRRWLRTAAVLLAGACAAPLAAVMLLAMAMPVDAGLKGVLRSWNGLMNTEVTRLTFYREVMGIGRPAANLSAMLRSLGIVALTIAPGLALEFALRGRTNPAWNAGIAAVLGAGTFAAWRAAGLYPPTLARPLPLLLLALLAWLGRRALTCDGPERRAALARAAYVSFALLLLAKVVLNVRFAHYGFVLALPGGVALVLAGTAWLPARLRAIGASGLFVGASVLGILGSVAFDHWKMTTRLLDAKTVAVGPRGDRIITDDRGRFVQAALQQIDERFGPADEILVVPEGISINYLARRRTPTRYLNFMPPELLLFGEREVLAALEAHPPAGIVVVHKDTSEYGYPLFGRDYGEELMRWITASYQPSFVDARGGRPLEAGTVFGLAILEPRSK